METQTKGHEQTRSVAERIGDQLEGHAGSETVFGRPIEREGVTVVPVSRVRFGFGGGGGSGRDPKTGNLGRGEGGGGGMQVTPLGFIELSQGRSVFKRVSDLRSIGLFLLATGLFLGMIRRSHTH